MKKSEKLFLLFLIICMLKIIINFFKYLRVKYLLKKYNAYLKNPDWEFSKHRHEILKLFKEAGIEDGGVSISQHVGYGTLKVQPISVLKNINYLNEDVINIMTGNFYSAIGYYKLRFLETFNPIFWIEIIVFLPKNIFTYIGFQSKNVLIKIFQVIYWILGLFASIYAIFNLNIFYYLFNQLK
ncbi:MAG: hypothetical protein P9L97_04195 [Candidatus Tenebribacter davisii]|nr:hypothetical protein [Candidatus Tenebribacter davisii]